MWELAKLRVVRNFCFALTFSLTLQEIENGNAKQKKIIRNPSSFSNTLQRNVFFFFFRPFNFFFPPIIFVIDGKFIYFKLFTANFFIIHRTRVLQ